LEKLKSEVLLQTPELLVANAKVWTVPNIVIYSLPVEYRVISSNIIDLLWGTIASTFVAAQSEKSHGGDFLNKQSAGGYTNSFPVLEAGRCGSMRFASPTLHFSFARTWFLYYVALQQQRPRLRLVPGSGHRKKVCMKSSNFRFTTSSLIKKRDSIIMFHPPVVRALRRPGSNSLRVCPPVLLHRRRLVSIRGFF